jgi:hypothetical protein
VYRQRAMNCQLAPLFGYFAVLLIAGAVAAQPVADAPANILRSPESVAARKYVLSADDESLLDEIQYGCFRYLWDEVGAPAGLVKDRGEAKVASTAAVGFQLASLPIGVERGWITRDEGRERATAILRALTTQEDNRKFGILLHFVDHNTGSNVHDSPDVQFSTVDHALLLAGAIPAAEYFGGEVSRLVERLIREADWNAYVREGNPFIGFGFKPSNPKQPLGPGEFIPYQWKWTSAEEQLVYLMAVGSPVQRHQVQPSIYYQLARPIRRHLLMQPHVVSWNGALFTYFFSHCFIDFGSLGPDDPSQFGVDAPRVDWFENYRRAVLTHRQRCIEMSTKYTTLAKNRWGLSACLGYLPDGRDTYLVPAIRPNAWDHEDWCGGTVAPYAAAGAIMVTPQESLEVLRELRHFRRNNESTLFAWRDPASGGYGLVDALNLDEGWAVRDHVGIDVGPMVLAIENIRTGLIWKLFRKSECVQRGMTRLKWTSSLAPNSKAN